MEVAGFALSVVGAVGVLGQLLDGCLKAYHVFTVASHLGRDSERLLCKIKIEEMRLMVWGREWGVAEGHFERTFSSGSPNEGLRELAELILTQLYQTIMDLNKLQTRYGLKEESPGSVDKDAYNSASDIKSLLAKGRAEGGLRLRARWVISDKEKFNVFLEDLQFFNDRLEKLFPPSRVGTLQRTWTHELLERAHRDLNALDLLQSASKPNYPSLGTFAELKQLRINLDARQPSKKILSSSELKVPRYRLVIEPDQLAQKHRSQATYQRPLDALVGNKAHEDVAAFIEWTNVDSGLALDPEYRVSAYQRVDNLARMLHSSSNRHPDLHTLDCIGFVDDSLEGRYGLVYAHPPSTGSSDMQSLAALISGSGPTPDLDVRFKLAHTIAVAVWACHSLDWLHKTLCPQNILFFSSSKSGERNGHGQATQPQIDVSAPYLAGFDSSRPEHLEEMSAAPRQLIGEELYRHPSSLGAHRSKYCKAFDVYSLGLVLLEIGLWKSLDVFYKGKFQKYSPGAFRDKIVQGLVPALGPKVGKTYKSIVQACLVYQGLEENPKASSAHQMMETIVQGLESLNV